MYKKLYVEIFLLLTKLIINTLKFEPRSANIKINAIKVYIFNLKIIKLFY